MSRSCKNCTRRNPYECSGTPYNICDCWTDEPFNWEKPKRRKIKMGSSRKEGGTKHLRFEKMPLEKGKKLHKYKVINDEFDQEIGIIHWRGGWRQYVFQALPKVDMSRSCHRVIDAFIDFLMGEWREELKNLKNGD